MEKYNIKRIIESYNCLIKEYKKLLIKLNNISIDSSSLEHNELKGLQGGIKKEYFHLTKEEFDYIKSIPKIIENLNTAINEDRVDKTLLDSLEEAVDFLSNKVDSFKSILKLKVDKENGKGLSQEDFTTVFKEGLEKLIAFDFTTKLDRGNYDGNAEDLKILIDNNSSAIETKVTKIVGKDLSTNDFTNHYKSFIDNYTPVDTSNKLNKGNYVGTAENLKSDIDHKVDKVDGKQLSTEDFTTELKQKLENLQNADLTPYLEKGGYTGTAQDLKNLIENILTILNSDDTELDQLQEIVNYIKQNKQILDTLSVTNIAGLQDALNSKADTNHTHSYNDLTDKPTLFSGNFNDLTNKPSLLTISNNYPSFESDLLHVVQIFDLIKERQNQLITRNAYNDITFRLNGVSNTNSFRIVTDNSYQNRPDIANFSGNFIEFNRPLSITNRNNSNNVFIKNNYGYLEIKNSYHDYANNDDFTNIKANGFMLPDGKKWLLLGDGTSIRMADFFRQKVSDTEARVSYNDIIRPRATGMYMMENNQDLLLEFNPQERKTRLQILYTPDGEDIKIRKFSPNTTNNEFKTIAFKEDLPLPESKKGIVISSNRYNFLSSNSEKTHFVMNPCVIDLSQLEDLESVTFKKCYNEMNSTRFEARGRTLIVRDNIQTHSSSDLNGLEGSYAVVSRVGQKIYINFMIYLPQHMLSPTGNGNVGSPTVVTSQPVRG